MKQEQFDFVIFLHSLSGILIKDRLKKQQYIFDYRDSTYEANMLFRHMIHSLVNGSYATFISSQGFLSYLPQTDKVYISHNLLLDSLKHREYQKILSEKIRICFWGHIRNVSVNKLLIEKIAKDDRFELHYYGREQGAAIALKEYCQENSLSNIFFHGEYEPSERYNFVKATDFIHNIYDDSNMQIAMGNKYYDGLIFKIPQLCTVGSFMGAQVQEKGVGIAVDPGDDALLSKIYDFYISLNRTVFEDNCETELKRVLAQYEVGQRLIGELGK